MIHPDTELRFVSREVGYGVFAVRPIPCGTLTWALDPLDQLFPPDRVASLDPAYRSILTRFAYVDLEGRTVLSWDHGRYVNHSCDPTSAGGGSDDFEIALRDIAPGEQITDDYAELDTDETFPCSCGAENCRGVVEPRARGPIRASLTRAVRAALGRAPHVPQPLLPFAREPLKIRQALESPSPWSGEPSRNECCSLVTDVASGRPRATPDTRG
jgi:uncharacterized protein